MANALQAALEKSRKPEPDFELTAPTPETIAAAKRRPSRKNTVLIGGHFAPEVKRQLNIIAAEEGCTNQDLIAEALDLLFVKKGKAKLAR